MRPAPLASSPRLLLPALHRRGRRCSLVALAQPPLLRRLCRPGCAAQRAERPSDHSVRVPAARPAPGAVPAPQPGLFSAVQTPHGPPPQARLLREGNLRAWRVFARRLASMAMRSSLSFYLSRAAFSVMVAALPHLDGAYSFPLKHCGPVIILVGALPLLPGGRAPASRWRGSQHAPPRAGRLGSDVAMAGLADTIVAAIMPPP